MKYLTIACLIIFLVTGVVRSALADHLIARATGNIAKATFQLDVMELTQEAPLVPSRHNEKQPGTFHFREIAIHCIQGCESDISYQENTPDTLISAFRLRDDSKDFITIWASGSAYWVRVYHIEDEGYHISKVMDAATKSAPQFNFNEKGELLIILNDPDSPDSIWKWNGKKYDAIANQKR